MGRKKSPKISGSSISDERGRVLWIVVLACFVFNMLLFQMIFHKHAVEYSSDQDVSLRGVRRRVNREKEENADSSTMLKNRPEARTSTSPLDRWKGSIDDEASSEPSSLFSKKYDQNDASNMDTSREDMLRRFSTPRKFDDLARPSDKVMVTEALETWRLLWRGIASACVFPDFQSDPQTSWQLIKDQLMLLQRGGIDVTGPVERIRQGLREKSEVMQDLQDGKKLVVAGAIVDSILESIRVSKYPKGEMNDGARVDRIDAMMLFRNLLNNKWHRKQQAEREAFFRKYHENFLEKHGNAASTVVSVSLSHPNHQRYFPPI